MTTPYRTLSRHEAGRQPDVKYDRQRFDNYTAWLDLQVRARQEARKVLSGEKAEGDLYGFSSFALEVPTTLPDPFLVQEPSFTSGDIVRRQYDKRDKVSSQHSAMHTVRTDPWHYPNSQAVQEHEHFDDYRSGSCSDIKPKNRPSDKERAAAVSDAMVKRFVFAASGAKASHFDKASAAVLFGKDIHIRPSPRALETLNVDLSCARMPKSVTAAVQAAKKETALSHRGEWGWCLDRGRAQTAAARVVPPSQDSKGREGEKLELSYLHGRAQPSRTRSAGNLQGLMQTLECEGKDSAGPGFHMYPSTPVDSRPGSTPAPPVSTVGNKTANLPPIKKPESNTTPDGAPVVPSGGKHALRGFAGTWSVDQGAGPGIGQFHVAKPARSPFTGAL